MKKYFCKNCGKVVFDSWPKVIAESNDIFCGDCAFINGLIDDKEYREKFLYFIVLDNVRACVRDNKIYVAVNRKFPWERVKNQQRNSAEYTEWRREVFERDSYTCVICGKVGGELNAHHIKPFSKYEEARLDINNGITLCKECHKTVHKNKDKRFLFFG